MMNLSNIRKIKEDAAEAVIFHFIKCFCLETSIISILIKNFNKTPPPSKSLPIINDNT